MRNNTPRVASAAVIGRRLVLSALVLLLSVELALSLPWRMVHDTPLLHYVAFLIDEHGFVPYRDVFETSMVGTFLFHLGIGKTLGYGDLGFRLVDLSYLLLLLALTWRTLRRIDEGAAWAGVIVYALLYLRHGPAMSLQKDCVGILPVAAAMLLASAGPAGPHLRSFAVGVCFGLASSIKPHLAIGYPILLIHLLVDHARCQRVSGKSLVRLALACAGVSVLGYSLALALPFAWLWHEGGLPAFYEMYASYLPLHLHLTGGHETIAGGERAAYLLRSYLRGIAPWVLPVLGGLGVALLGADLGRRARRLVLSLGLLALTYSLYPALAGQFWSYHWMPFKYFAVLCSVLLLAPLARRIELRGTETLLLAIFVLTMVFTLPKSLIVRQAQSTFAAPPKEGRVDEIARFLRAARLGPGDRVQPLDWAEGGAVHAMLIAKAVVATRFIYDYHFYHHVSDPFIQELRRRLLEELEARPPRFVIDMKVRLPISGEDTSRSFPELEQFLSERYHLAHQGNGFRILQLHSGGTN